LSFTEICNIQYLPHVNLNYFSKKYYVSLYSLIMLSVQFQVCTLHEGLVIISYINTVFVVIFNKSEIIKSIEQTLQYLVIHKY